MLQGGTSWVKGVVEVIIEQTAEGSHIDIRKTAQAAREVCGIMARAKDTAKLRVEEVLGECPVTACRGRKKRKRDQTIRIAGFHSPKMTQRARWNF